MGGTHIVQGDVLIRQLIGFGLKILKRSNRTGLSSCADIGPNSTSTSEPPTQKPLAKLRVLPTTAPERKPNQESTSAQDVHTIEL